MALSTLGGPYGRAKRFQRRLPIIRGYRCRCWKCHFQPGISGRPSGALNIIIENFFGSRFFKGDGQFIAFNRFNAAIAEFLMEYPFAAFKALLLMEETTGSALRINGRGGALVL